MTQSPDADLAALERLSSLLSATLAAIKDHQWTIATPCTDWDLSDLVDHITGGNWFTSRILTGLSAEEALSETMALFGGTSVTADRAVASAAEQTAAFRQPGVLDRVHHHVAGHLPGRTVLRLRLHDLIVHNWDVDQTLTPPATIPTDLVQWGLAELADPSSQTADQFGLATTQTPATNEAAYLQLFGRERGASP